MKKNITLSNGKTIVFDSVTSEGYDEILTFYESKLNTLVGNFRVPFHDSDDLKQICRMKLLEALKTFNPKKNVGFSTYLYTILNRKMFQTTVKYKTKKHSGYIENDNYVNMNHSYDKLSNGQYLQTGKDRCPINKKVITPTMCYNCPHHIKYKSKTIEKGNEQGETKKFTLCSYYKEVMSKRGGPTKSLDAFNAQDTNLLSFIICNKQKKTFEDDEFKMQFSILKSHLSPEYFEILEMVLDGYNKSEIIEKLKLTNLKFNRILDKISKHRKVKELLLEN